MTRTSMSLEQIVEAYELTLPKWLIDDGKFEALTNTEENPHTFDGTGTVEMQDGNPEMELKIILEKINETSPWEATLEGGVRMGPALFDVDFDGKSRNVSDPDDSFYGDWLESTPEDILTFSDLGEAFGFAPPEGIPEGLETGITSAKFAYNAKISVLVFTATADHDIFGGIALMVWRGDQPDGIGNELNFLFMVSFTDKITVPDSPVLDVLMKMDLMAFHTPCLLLSSKPLKPETVVGLNEYLRGDGERQDTFAFPDGGTGGKVNSAFDLEVMGDKTPVGVTDKKEVESSRLQASPPGANPQVQVQKSHNGVTINRIGFEFEEGFIWASVDVTFALSKITFRMMDFMVGVNLVDKSVQYRLHGINVGYKSTAMTLSGGLYGTIDPVDFVGQVRLRGIGGLNLSLLMGVSYDVDGNDLFSIFGFGMMERTIVNTNPKFRIDGFALGMGVHRDLILPTMDKMNEFPLVSAALSVTNTSLPNPFEGAELPSEFLLPMLQYVPTAPGKGWGAGGIAFTLFQTINCFAMLSFVVQEKPKFMVVGFARTTFPPNSPVKTAIANVEMMLKAEIYPEDGFFGIQGELTPLSFVIFHDCLLTGGFALNAWFSGEHKGEFILTVGGYHPAFPAPDHYPSVPRVGFICQLGEAIQIKGGCFFALTSAAIMAGGYLQATWSAGPIRAWFNFEAAFLVMWDPLFYDITARIHIGGEINVWIIVQLTIDFELGLELHLWGPEFSGEATIHLAVISFTLEFGAGASQEPPALSYSEFEEKFLPDVPDESAGRNTKEKDVLKLELKEGLLREVNRPDLDWVVDPEHFHLTAISMIPAKDSSLQGEQVGDNLDDNWAKAFGIAPMKLDPDDFQSSLTLTLDSDDSESIFEVEAELDNASAGLWAKDPLADPVNNTTIPQALIGYSIKPSRIEAGSTLQIDVQSLLFDEDTEPSGAYWNAANLGSSQFGPETSVEGTIEEVDAKSNRESMLDELSQLFPVDTDLDLSAMTEETYFMGTPRFQLLGEEKALENTL